MPEEKIEQMSGGGTIIVNPNRDRISLVSRKAHINLMAKTGLRNSQINVAELCRRELREHNLPAPRNIKKLAEAYIAYADKALAEFGQTGK